MSDICDSKGPTLNVEYADLTPSWLQSWSKIEYYNIAKDVQSPMYVMQPSRQSISFRQRLCLPFSKIDERDIDTITRAGPALMVT